MATQYWHCDLCGASFKEESEANHCMKENHVTDFKKVKIVSMRPIRPSEFAWIHHPKERKLPSRLICDINVGGFKLRAHYVLDKETKIREVWEG